MNVEQLREYCLAKSGSSESFPFDETSLVLKVLGKMFGIISLDGNTINLKCGPERAILLREEYPDDIFPGYHMNKKHWNSVVFDGNLSQKQIEELIDHSYVLVVSSLPKKTRELL